MSKLFFDIFYFPTFQTMSKTKSLLVYIVPLTFQSDIIPKQWDKRSGSKPDTSGSNPGISVHPLFYLAPNPPLHWLGLHEH